MLLSEILKDIAEHQSAGKTFDSEEFSGLSKEEVKEILYVTAQAHAVEENMSRLADQPQVGSRLADMAREASDLGLAGNIVETLENLDPHLPFFISSLGPHMVNIVDTFFSAKYYKDLARTKKDDMDHFFSYYRTSTGTAMGLGAFSGLNEDTDVILETFKNSLGIEDVPATTMPQHLSLPHLGLGTESSIIGGHANTAIGMAMALGPLLRDGSMPEDQIVHMLIGDSGVNEPSFRNAYGMLENHLSLIARHYLEMTDEDMEAAIRDPTIQEEIHEWLREEGHMLRLATHIFDNGIGISAKKEGVHPYGDPLSSIRHLEERGILEIIEYDTFDFKEVLRRGKEIDSKAREGIVAAHIKIPRPGGHSLSNFYGFGSVREGRSGSPTGSLSLEDAIRNNNNDPLHHALKNSIDEGVLTRAEAEELIHNAQRSVLERLAYLVPGQQPKSELKRIHHYQKDKAQERWDRIVQEKKQRRDALWEEHAPHVAKKPGIGFKLEDGLYLPEERGRITPLQAENFSIADIAMMLNLRAVGEDIPDSTPSELERVIKDPRQGTGGINKAMAGIQVLAHTLNPDTGRYHVLDIGINEAGIYALGEGLQRALGEDGVALIEIQFNDYDFPLFGLENISSLFQRSNHQENVPVIIRQSYGFMRGQADTLFERGGASGTYHSSARFGPTAGRHPGLHIVAPSNAQAVQMAYRNAVAGQTPTMILMSAPVMKGLKFGNFDYSAEYLSLDEPLDPVPRTYEWDFGLAPGEHEHVILTYGEYVPVSHMIAEELNGEGISTKVVDYNYIMPRDEELPDRIMSAYRSRGEDSPHFHIISQEGRFGFGSVILSDLVEYGVPSERINTIFSEDRPGGWLEEFLVHPTPDEIRKEIKRSHTTRKD